MKGVEICNWREIAPLRLGLARMRSSLGDASIMSPTRDGDRIVKSRMSDRQEDWQRELYTCREMTHTQLPLVLQTRAKHLQALAAQPGTTVHEFAFNERDHDLSLVVRTGY
jgi:hypothetical protein